MVSSHQPQVMDEQHVAGSYCHGNNDAIFLFSNEETNIAFGKMVLTGLPYLSRDLFQTIFSGDPASFTL